MIAPKRTRAQSTTIYLSGQSRPIGHVRSGVFYKTIAGSKHMLRSPRAIAFDVSTLNDAKRAGATHVPVKDTETGTVYLASIDAICDHGFSVMRGHGSQIALTLDRYGIDGEAPAALLNAGTSNQERKNLQLGLFEVPCDDAS